MLGAQTGRLAGQLTTRTPARAAEPADRHSTSCSGAAGGAGRLGTRVVNSEALEQWPYEGTSGGRLWYCIDDRRRIVWLTHASVGHPKSEE
jgi:hypothetical protein